MPLLSRLLTALLVLALALVLLAAGVWHLAYGTAPSYSGEVGLPGLGAPVTLSVDEAGVATIEAATEADLAAGLGYVHALQRAWPMALWRQLATGSMSRWREDSTALALDRHARTLGLGALARATYEDLEEEERALLDAYARGVNRAFEKGRLAEGDAFVLEDVRPEAWAPWDALAVERLVAYLMAPSPAVPADSASQAALAASPSLRRFLEADSLFRSVLHLGDAEFGLAFAVRDSAGTALVQRHVYGSSALPLLREVVVRHDGGTTALATVPGTLMLPGGYGEAHAWSVLLTGSPALTLAPGALPPPHYERVVTASGREVLVTAHLGGGALFLEAPAPPDVPTDTTATAEAAPPSAWQLRWRGFAAGTDLAAWRALLRGEAPAFALLDGHGLRLTADGEAEVLGAPALVRRLPEGVLVGGHPLARFAAERLEAFEAGPAAASPEDLATDAHSPWAARLAPPLIDALGAPGEREDEFRDAAAFLRGWDFHYRPASIGASIFEAWMEAYREATGALPNPDSLQLEVLPPEMLPPEDSLHAEMPSSLADSLRAEPVEPGDLRLLKQTLRLALARLREGFGPSGASWRWERVQGALVRFPLRDDLAPADSTARFAPALLPEGGHPTALAWGPSRLFPGADAAAVWTAWGRVPGGGAAVLHRDLLVSGFLARHLARTEPLEARRLAPASGDERRLRLLPEG